MSYALQYGKIQESTFSKSGKEIKEKMESLAINCKSAIDKIKKEKSELVTEIGCMPTESLDRWDKRGVGEYADEIKKFHYSMTYYNETQGTNDGNAFASVDFSSGDSKAKAVVTHATSKEMAENARKYNRMVHECLEKCRDLFTLMTFKRNLKDKEKYKLSAKELIILGF